MTQHFVDALLWLLAHGMLMLIMVILSAQNIVYFTQLFCCLIERGKSPASIGTKRDLWSLQGSQSPGVSIIAPAFNEELTIAQSARSLLSNDYPLLEVIIINDGSKDNMMEILKSEFHLVPSQRKKLWHLDHQPIHAIYESQSHPNLLIVDKANGRKADAANAGICYAQYPLISVTDADSLLESDALLRATAPFLSDDGSLVAVGCSIRLTNGCRIAGGKLIEARLPKTYIERFQMIEYLRAFMVARIASSSWDVLMLISGGFGVFKRDAVLDAGGYLHNTVGEDLELVVRLHRIGLETGKLARVAYVPDAVCWTEAPASCTGLRNQRTRWQQGALETLRDHRIMLFNKRYGRIGLAGMPMIFLEDVLVPVAEVLGYALIPIFLWLNMTSGLWLIGMLFLSFMLGTALSIGALFQEDQQIRGVTGSRDYAILIFCAFVENFGYRQFNTFCRLRGIKKFFGKETAWAAVPRVGFIDS